MLTSYYFFKKLPGTWAFNRVLNNLLEPKLSGSVSGSAKFSILTNEPNLIYYYEYGTFITAGGSKLQVNKEYFFVFNEKTGNVEKHFAQNGIIAGLFYILDPDFAGEHLCVKDNYKANYEFLNDDLKEFTLKYTVIGANKNYTSTTRYNFIN